MAISPQIAYTTTDGVTYTYEQPSPNKSGYEPQPAPSAYFPTRGVKLNAETAIGGGPILLKDGSVRNTFIEELFDERKWSCSRKLSSKNRYRSNSQ